MSWLEVAAIAMVLLGVGAAGFLVAQRPTFWYSLLSIAVQAGLKAALPYLLKRMPPDEEEAWRACQRRAGRWNHRTRRCE